MGRAKQSPGAWPGARRSTNCNANCGVSTQSPTRTPVAMDFVAAGAFATPVKDQVLIYTPESREAIVCKFLAQGNYAIARHYCDLNFATLQGPGCFHSLNALSNQLSHSTKNTHTHTHQVLIKLINFLLTPGLQTRCSATSMMECKQCHQERQ